MKKWIFLTLFIALNYACKEKKTPKFKLLIKIPTAGNTWVKKKDSLTLNSIITKKGVVNWSNNILRTYFFIHKPTEISLGINLENHTKKTRLSVSFNGEKKKELKLNSSDSSKVFINNYKIKKAGYHYLDIENISKNTPLNIQNILVGISDKKNIDFSRDDFYWSHRGPSTHLNYQIPKEINNIQYYYSEINVPKKNDVIGTFYMANGFQYGYFGIQVNSKSERRILFSVWSPYKTDNPNSIPKDFRIQLLKKGEGVTTGKFGNEGSGGQSYKVFNWKPNIDYKFLLKAEPFKDNTTNFTAYFYDPELSKWYLIASFKRPKTQEYLKRFHGFLECFIPKQGSIERKANYTNQWVYNSDGWHEINSFKFSADNTARKKNRLDYSGGITNNAFYLRAFGFFNDNTKIGSLFTKDKTNKPPQINFKELD
ncbi:MAG: DUF3472 domain-containing protein [Flavobacteriaceae bacterium]|nr:DUF3472 domain-containing protein [Flavobacteriaceae bacterium]